jgi:two-component system nitrogen regulation sensor histidine kinase NtrY
MKNIRFIALLVFIAIIVVSIFAIEIHYMGRGNISFMTKLILFILLNLNIVALLTLMFFVGKSLLKVYFERKHRVLGYKFKTKFVVVLVVLTLIPTAFLFLVSSGVVTRYLDRWFDPQIKKPLDLSIEIAQSAYEMQRQQTMLFAEAIVSGEAVPDNYTVLHLQEVPQNASETIKGGFEGKAGTEVITEEGKDVIRAVMPKYKGNKQTGIIVVESFIGKNIAANAEAIKEAYQSYLTLESWKTPLKTNYLLVLSFFTLIIVFMALWAALRISRGITDPIQILAQSTEQVAGGDLDVHIDISREDEIGQLVSAFNNMVRGLKEGQRSGQIIEKILENINSGVISLDTEGSILTINTAACRILNVSTDDVINKNYSVLISKLESEELKEMVKSIVIRDFKGIEREVKVNVGDRRVLLRIFITPLRDAQEFLGTLVVFDDLTDVVRAQKALAWQEVAKRIAHEIKNPLTPIKLSTEHMIKKWLNKDDDFSHTFDRSTKTIINEVESLRRLVDEFSRFGKMPEIHKSSVFISTIIGEVVNLYKDYKGIEITVTNQGEEMEIELDAEQFKRVIINIVDNAIQAMQNTGKISIHTHHDVALNKVYVDIADDGPSIQEEVREKLFLPYFSTKKNGTGLGLAIASRVITEHRGYIRVRDNKPAGTIFTIELPIKEG